MSREVQRTADLVEPHALCARSTTFMRKHGDFDSGRQHDPLAAPERTVVD